MKKQFINVVIVAALMALIASAAGCTSNPTSPPASSAPPVNAGELSASDFTDRYLSVYNDTLITPFSATTNERGHTVYTGVTNSSSGEHDKVTVEMCKSDVDAEQTFQQHINAAKQTGYVQSSSGNGTWEGAKSNGNAAPGIITINMVSPSSPDFDYLGIGYAIESFEGTG